MLEIPKWSGRPNGGLQRPTAPAGQYPSRSTTRLGSLWSAPSDPLGSIGGGGIGHLWAKTKVKPVMELRQKLPTHPLTWQAFPRMSHPAGSPAEFAGLQAKDIIVQLNNQAVTSVGELQKLADGQKVLGMKIVRGKRVLLRVIR